MSNYYSRISFTFKKRHYCPLKKPNWKYYLFPLSHPIPSHFDPSKTKTFYGLYIGFTIQNRTNNANIIFHLHAISSSSSVGPALSRFFGLLLPLIPASRSPSKSLAADDWYSPSTPTLTLPLLLTLLEVDATVLFASFLRLRRHRFLRTFSRRRSLTKACWTKPDQAYMQY